MNADELKQLGVTDEETIQKIIISHGKGIEKIKQDLEAANTAKAQTEADAQKKLADLQAKYDADLANSKKNADKVKFDTAIERALEKAKAKNIRAARAILDEADLTLTEDGSIAGLDERVAKVVAENAFLFGSDAQAQTRVIPKVVAKTTNPPPTPEDPMTAAIRKGAGLPPVKVR